MNKFQSYLYGIEIKRHTFSCTHNESFNRTFMELKFKSIFEEKRRNVVSIVPLWN